MFDAGGLSQGYRTSNTCPGSRLSEGQNRANFAINFMGKASDQIQPSRQQENTIFQSEKIKMSGNRSPPRRHLTRPTYIHYESIFGRRWHFHAYFQIFRQYDGFL